MQWYIHRRTDAARLDALALAWVTDAFDAVLAPGRRTQDAGRPARPAARRPGASGGAGHPQAARRQLRAWFL